MKLDKFKYISNTLTGDDSYNFINNFNFRP